MRFAMNQTVVYWAPAGNDREGNPNYADPVQRRARWEDRMEETIGPQGDNILSSATIYLDQPITNGGLLFLGNLSQIILPFDLLANLSDGNLWGQNGFVDPHDGNPSPIVLSGSIQSNNPAFAEATTSGPVTGATNSSPVVISILIKPVFEEATQPSFVVDVGDAFVNHWSFTFRQGGFTTGQAAYSVDGADDNGATMASIGLALPVGQLSLLRLEMNGQTATLYVNGQKIDQKTFTSDPQTLGRMVTAFSFFTNDGPDEIPGAFLIYKYSVTNGKTSGDIRSDRRVREIINAGSVPALHRSQVLYTAMVR